MKALVISLANSWGTFLIIFLLGYGLIEIPRYILNLTNYSDRIKYLEWKTKINNDSIDERTEELNKCIEELNNIATIPLIINQDIDDYFYSNNNNLSNITGKEIIEMDDQEIEKLFFSLSNKYNYEELVEYNYTIKCKKMEIEKLTSEITHIYSEWFKLNVLFGDFKNNNDDYNYNKLYGIEGDNEVTNTSNEYKDLSIAKEESNTFNKENRASFPQKLSEIGLYGKAPLKKLDLNTINNSKEHANCYKYNTKNNNDRKLSDSNSYDGLQNITHKNNYSLVQEGSKEESTIISVIILYNRYFYQLFFKVLAFKFIVMSLFIVFSEMNVFYQKKNDIITNLILENQSFITVSIICLIPTAYMFIASVFGLFNLEIHSYYGIYEENNTDTYSFFFLTSFLCRVIFPLCLNCLQILNIYDTTLQRNMKISEIIPVFGDDFQKFFPTILFFLCFIHYFNGTGRFLNSIGLNYIFYEDYKKDVNKVREGNRVLTEIKNSQ